MQALSQLSYSPKGVGNWNPSKKARYCTFLPMAGSSHSANFFNVFQRFFEALERPLATQQSERDVDWR